MTTLAVPVVQGVVLFEDDFGAYGVGGDISSRWSLQQGQACVKTEGLEIRNSGTDGFHLEGVSAGSEAWTDYQLSFETKVLSSGDDWRDGVWLGVRCWSWNQYCVQFYKGKIFLYKILIGQSITGNIPIARAVAAQSGFGDGNWHRVTVTVQGANLTVEIDRATVLEFKDTDATGHLGPIPRGRIMLGCRRWTRSTKEAVALFRNVRVLALNAGAGQPDQFGLENMTRPWDEREIWPSYEDVMSGLRDYAQRHPQFVDLEEFGRALEGEPIVAARITDKSVPDADKHSILITALDSGWERGGTCGAMRMIDWLLSQDPLATESLRNHVVGVLPIPNPYGYKTHRATNSKGVNTYHGGRARSDHWDLESLTVKNPEEAPHLVALTRVFDRFQPEFHLDLHGVGLKYAGQLVQPSLGSAYSNTANRPWDWRLLEAMMSYASREGYGHTRLEVDSQQLFCSDQMQPLTKRFWMGRPFFYSAHYGYAKYHTMPCTSEVAWPDGAVAAIKGLLDFGNRQIASASVPGYPVNHVRTFLNYRVCSYGATISARRKSRVALWQRQEELGLGFLYNYTDGRDMLVCTLGKQAYDQLYGQSKQGGHLPAVEFLRNLKHFPHVNAPPVEAFVLSGPQRAVAFDAPSVDQAFEPLDSGLALEIPVYYQQFRPLHLMLNGTALAESSTDGYQFWYSPDDGYSIVRVNIPAARLAGQQILVVTLAYLPGESRSYSWSPAQQQ